jgi:hypothetical protein
MWERILTSSIQCALYAVLLSERYAQLVLSFTAGLRPRPDRTGGGASVIIIQDCFVEILSLNMAGLGFFPRADTVSLQLGSKYWNSP